MIYVDFELVSNLTFIATPARNICEISRKWGQSMGYRNLRECVDDLASNGQLIRIEQEIDPNLEAGAVQRRVYQSGGPALLFTRVKGCSFPMLGNLFGTLDRARFLFQDTLDDIRRLVDLKVNPAALLQDPFGFLRTVPAALRLFPRRLSNGPVLSRTIRLDQLRSA